MGNETLKTEKKDLEILWLPKAPNRGTVKTYAHYQLYMSYSAAMVNVWYVDSSAKFICKKIINETNKKHLVYKEALESIDNTERQNHFTKSWMTASARVLNHHTLFPDSSLQTKWRELKHLVYKEKFDAIRDNGEVVEFKTDMPLNAQIASATVERLMIKEGVPFLASHKKQVFPKVTIEVDKNKKEIIDLGPFNYRNQSELLVERFNMLGKEINVRELAEKLNFKDSSMISKHLNGEREISRAQAITYGQYLGCDPADILFPKPLVKVWAHINFLNFSEAGVPYGPGELIPQAEENFVECPRDVYRPDVKAVRVKSPGSYLDNHIIFYYNSNRVEEADIGKLCIVGIDEGQIDPEMEKYTGGAFRYFCGIYESHRGKRQFLNPDPFAIGKKIKDMANHDLGVILNDNWSQDIFFTAPVVAVINPAMLVENKKTSQIFKNAQQVTAQNEVINDYILKQQEARETKEKDILQQIEKQKELIEKIIQDANKLKEQSKETGTIGPLKEFYDTIMKKRA